MVLAQVLDSMIPSISGDGVGVGVEDMSRVVVVSGKVESSAGHDLTKLGDTSVLDLDITEAVEALLGDVSGEHAEGIEESERGLSVELVLEGADSQGRLGHGGGGKSGGRADAGCNDGRLHVGCGRDEIMRMRKVVVGTKCGGKHPSRSLLQTHNTCITIPYL